MSTLQADLSILWPALIAGVLVVLSHVPLGQQVLARGIVFIDLAIAQVAGLGVIAAHVSGLGAGGWITQVAAAAAALVGALLLTWTERKRPEAQEALIGVLFVLASTAQILLLANDPHGGEDLKDLLAGQILWVTPRQLVHAAIVTGIQGNDQVDELRATLQRLPVNLTCPVCHLRLRPELKRGSGETTLLNRCRPGARTGNELWELTWTKCEASIALQRCC